MCKGEEDNKESGNTDLNEQLENTGRIREKMIFSRVLRDSSPRYVGTSVRQSVPFLLFRRFLAF